jgi:hypothetical protein
MRRMRQVLCRFGYQGRGAMNDVRILETDHFVAFRRPEAISDAVIEAVNRNRARRSKS